jgi:hypothetical protein
MNDKEALAALTAVVQKGAIPDKTVGDGMAVAKVLGAAKTIIGLLQQKMSARTGLEGIVLRVRQEEQELKMAIPIASADDRRCSAPMVRPGNACLAFAGSAPGHGLYTFVYRVTPGGRQRQPTAPTSATLFAPAITHKSHTAGASKHWRGGSAGQAGLG